MPELPNEGQGTRNSDSELAQVADDGGGVDVVDSRFFLWRLAIEDETGRVILVPPESKTKLLELK